MKKVISFIAFFLMLSITCYAQNYSCSSAKETLDNTLEVGLFPNPSTGSFNLNIQGEAKYAEVEICNFLGELIFNDSIDVAKRKSINFEEFNEGIYLIKVVIDGNKKFHQRLIITK